jgi:hypothetical protein
MSSVFEKVEQYEPAARAVDATAVSVLAGVVLGWLPHVATLLTVIWMGFRLANEIHKWRTRNDPKFFNRRKGD